MAFLKAKLAMILFILVCAGSIGMGVWGWMSGDEVTQAMEQVNRLRTEVSGAKRSAVNSRVIEEKKKLIAEANAEFEKAMNDALAVQKNNLFYATLTPDGKFIPKPRELLLPNALPKPSKADRIDFKRVYQRAFDETVARLKGRDKPSMMEMRDYEARLRQLRAQPAAEVSSNPWMPTQEEKPAESGLVKERSLAEILKDSARARSAEEVARSISMYVTENAIVPHRLLRLDVPNDTDVWQAQMGLWIQQDMVALMALMNEERVAELRKSGKEEQAWVAYLPIKNLIALRFANALGNGGGSNTLGAQWAPSFTGITNSEKLFVVPIQLELVLEESMLAKFLERLTSLGFYTPIAVNYRAVPPNPMQEDYIYGEAPVIQVKVDIEGYYFRKVFDPWIPEALKPFMKLPGAIDPKLKAGS